MGEGHVSPTANDHFKIVKYLLTDNIYCTTNVQYCNIESHTVTFSHFAFHPLIEVREGIIFHFHFHFHFHFYFHFHFHFHIFHPSILFFFRPENSVQLNYECFATFIMN